MNTPIVLIGLSGTGKSSVGALLARALGWDFVDTDTHIEATAGQAIATIFAENGEDTFRELETRALEHALRGGRVVVATGGGIVERPANATLLRSARVVWLTASTETLAQRLAEHTDRPLLRTDPRAALQAQAERRSARYAALADWIVATEHLSAEQTVAEIVRYVEQATASNVTPASGLLVTTPGGSYEVVVEEHALGQLPRRLRDIAPRGRVWIVSNDQIWPIHGPRLLSILSDAGITAQHYEIPEGEASKNLAVVAEVYAWLLGNGVERGDVVLAFGGGVVGDLSGFVAATVLRGIAFIQLPTTVLAMVDSSIGGKTGVDHVAGKNLIGSFYQPRLVLADTALLRSLPPAVRQGGWTEAIKHGVIADAQLFHDLADAAPVLLDVREPQTSELIRRAAAVKVTTVSGDEREHGARILLNYGHTIGHALEHWSNYRISHGHAVAMGMGVAASIAHRLGMCDASLMQEQAAVLRAFGLPVHLPADADPVALLEATRSDKKVQQKKIRWVLPTAIGAATVRNDVPTEVVISAIEEARETPSAVVS